MSIPPSDAEHIGDGVYIHFDGAHLWLSTEREHGWENIAFDSAPMVHQFVKKAVRIFGKSILENI